MEIQSISLAHFRNYEGGEVRFSPKCNLLFGENAQGKTNLLEACAYLSGAKSHRTRGDKDLIQFGHHSAEIKASVRSRDRDFSMELTLFRQGRRRIVINGVKQKTTASLSDVLRTVLFSPEDLSLIWAGAAARRRFLDQCLCQLRPRYREALAQYSRLYEHKTRILRDWDQKKSLLSLLDTFANDMARYGAVLISYRAKVSAENAGAVFLFTMAPVPGARSSRGFCMKPFPPWRIHTRPQSKFISGFWPIKAATGRRSWRREAACPAPIKMILPCLSKGSR
ncbi:MAG: DNA replication/repair protein RecF [Oscillospiraceae bacterium]